MREKIMKLILGSLFTCILLRVFADNESCASEWTDLDHRPLPQWYDAAKIGIFIHWGLYSVPAFKGEWFWFLLDNGDKEVLRFLRNYTYHSFQYYNYSKMFKAEMFDPDAWAKLFLKAGAKYVILTAKHHEGYALFPSKSGAPLWNSVDTGPKRDIVKELSKSVKKLNMTFGVYYSLLEWHNDIYLEDKETDFVSTKYVDNVVWKDIKQLIEDYHPSVLWLDGEWEAYCDYWKTKELLAWIYNESPVKTEIVVNDRLGKNLRRQHGDFYNGEDRFNPKKLMLHKWENAFSLDRMAWGYRKDIASSEILSIEEVIEDIVTTVSCGGNALINVGPTKEGIIPPIFQERLLALGDWLHINGEAIYGTSPWFHQNDSLNSGVWYTCDKQNYDPSRVSNGPNADDSISAVYAIFLKWPSDNVLRVKDLDIVLRNMKFQIYLLPNKNTSLDFSADQDVVDIVLPVKKPKIKYGWVLKIAE